MKKMWITILVILIIIVIVSIAISIKKQEKNNKLEFTVLNNREEELAFSFSINDFINSYNSFYLKDKKKTYLSKLEEWRCLVYDKAIHSKHEIYNYYFTENTENQILPFLEVYVPLNNDYVQEIMLNFDYHSYIDKYYDLYEEMCFYSLKVVFGDLEDEKIIELYKTINQLACDNIFPADRWYETDAIPCALYHRNGVGVYPYFATGQHLKLCIIPVNEQLLQNFEEKGVYIHEIKVDS